MEETNEKDRKAIGKYYSIAWQTITPVIIGVIVGQYLDGYLNNKTPWMTIILSTVMIVVALYLLIKTVTKG